MAITCTKLDSGVATTASSSFSSNSISSPTGRLLLACFITCEGTRTHTCTDDNGNSWTKISEGHYDTDRTISWHYLIVPGTPLSGNIVICTPSGTHNQGHWCILEINGHDGTTPIAQSPAIATGSGTTLSKTLSSPAGSGSKHFICVGQSVFQALSPDANTTELADHSGNSAGSPLGNAFAVGWSNADFETTCGFTGSTSGNWGALSIEVQEPASGTTVTGLSPVAATAAVGTIASINMSATPTTVGATASVNAPVVRDTVTPVTVAATAAVGTIASINKSATPTTVAAVAAVNTVGISETAIVSTVAATASVGTVAIAKTATPLTVSAIAAVNSVSIAKTVVPVSVAAIAAVNAPVLLGTQQVVTVNAVAAVNGPNISFGDPVPITAAAVASVNSPVLLGTQPVATVAAIAAVNGVTIIEKPQPLTVGAVAIVLNPVLRETAVLNTVAAVASVLTPTIDTGGGPPPAPSLISATKWGFRGWHVQDGFVWAHKVQRG